MTGTVAVSPLCGRCVLGLSRPLCFLIGADHSLGCLGTFSCLLFLGVPQQVSSVRRDAKRGAPCLGCQSVPGFSLAREPPPPAAPENLDRAGNGSSSRQGVRTFSEPCQQQKARKEIQTGPRQVPRLPPSSWHSFVNEGWALSEGRRGIPNTGGPGEAWAQ